MLKRILTIWIIANFAIVGLVSFLAGGRYLGWHVPPAIGMLTELSLIMLPNLILPILVLRYWWFEPIDSIRKALGWQWNGWVSLGASVLALVVFYLLIKVIVRRVGGSIPYNPPATAGEGLALSDSSNILKALMLLLGLLVFVIITVVGEETMFRGWIQTQVAGRESSWGLGRIAAGYGAFWVAPPAR